MYNGIKYVHTYIYGQYIFLSRKKILQINVCLKIGTYFISMYVYENINKGKGLILFCVIFFFLSLRLSCCFCILYLSKVCSMLHMNVNFA